MIVAKLPGTSYGGLGRGVGRLALNTSGSVGPVVVDGGVVVSWSSSVLSCVDDLRRCLMVSVYLWSRPNARYQ